MKKSVVETIERALDRRKFVKKVAAVTGAFITGVLVAPKRAAAKAPDYCCNLVFTPGDPPWPTTCACTWCWVCKEPIDCFKYKCKECIQSFPGACTPQICLCHNTDHVDACRTSDGVVASSIQNMGRYYPCTPS
jgi:hypothetical protein